MIEYIHKPHPLIDETIPNLTKFPTSFLQLTISQELYNAICSITETPHATFKAIMRDHAIRNKPDDTTDIVENPYKGAQTKGRQLIIVLPLEIYDTLCTLESKLYRSKSNLLRKLIFDAVKNNDYPTIRKHTTATTSPGGKIFTIVSPEVAFTGLAKNAKKQKTSRNNLIIHIIKEALEKIKTP